MLKQFSRRSQRSRPANVAPSDENGCFNQDAGQESREQHPVAQSEDPYGFPEFDEPAVLGATSSRPSLVVKALQVQPPSATAQEVPTAGTTTSGRKSPLPLGAETSPPKRARATASTLAAREQSAVAGPSDANPVAPPHSPPKAAQKPTAALKSARPAPKQADVAADPGGKAAAAGSSGAGGSGGSRRQGSGRGRAAAAAGSGGRRSAAAAGSGGSRAASGSGKRSKCSSPVTDNGPGSKAGCVPAKQAPQGSVTLPTPHRPVGLIPAGLFLAAEARPAQTVMEAQERGELVQMQDDARYAMDGLAASCSIDTQRESAVTLTEMLCSRKGRLALRADGLAQQVLSSLAKLKAAKDCVLGLASTLVLLMLTSEDAHPAYLASVAAAVIMEQLLQFDHSFEEVAACCPSGAKLSRLLKSRPLCSLLASTGVTSQRDLLLITLEQATSFQQPSKAKAVEKLKENLQKYGALARLGKLVATVAAGNATAAARQLRLMLLVLENATFSWPENGQALVQLQVAGPTGKGQAQQQQPFPVLLVQIAEELLTSLDDAECSEALHVCLSVLMNLSHQNPEGAAVISGAGGLRAAAAVIMQLVAPVQHSHQALCQQVLQNLELISVALGVLINLVSGEPDNSRQLAAVTAGSSTDVMEEEVTAEAAGGGDSSGSSLVSLLCRTMTAVAQLLQAVDDEGAELEESDDAEQGTGTAAAQRSKAAAGAGRRPPGGGLRSSAQQQQQQCFGSSSPTAADGELDSSSAGEASIVEMYCGMLLGFLVRDCERLADIVAEMMDDGTLQPIVLAVHRCLAFYVSAHAITDHTRTTLEELLQFLNASSE